MNRITHPALKALRLDLRLATLIASLERRYRPDQPRAPKGTPEGGQWIDDSFFPTRADDARVQVAQAGGLARVNLLDHEGVEGSHTISDHVGKPDDYLLARVGGGAWYGLFVDVVTYRAGTFSSLASANRLVNSTLARHREIVIAVGRGDRSDAFLTAEFGSPTGREAFRSGPYSQPFLRTTTGVGVYIVHDNNFPSGYRIVTAYPRSD